MKQEKQTAAKLGVLGLMAIVVSSMIGGGIFSLPQNMAASASVGAIIIAWVITGIGIYFIANCFKILALAKPNLTSGIYKYSASGFGDYMGFNIGWSYWLCQIFGNVGYGVITMDALNYFFPGKFIGGNNLNSIIGASLLIWFFNFLVLKGVRQATIINTITTIAKIIPLILFIVILLCVFKMNQFNYDFWGNLKLHGKNLGGLSGQIKSTMLVTLWAFIGIEGAVVLSGRAKDSSSVGKATILGFLICWIVYILLSILPFGFLSQAEIALVANPSTAGVLEKVVGPWGAWLMNGGLILAVLGSWLAWTIIVAEMPFTMAQNGVFPKIFQKENKNNAPQTSLWITSFLMQASLFLVYFSNNAWNTMLSITGIMVLPAYFFSCCYLLKLCLMNDYPNIAISKKMAFLSSILGAIYSLWLIYAAGFNYLLMAIIFIALGLPIYLKAKKENNPLFQFRGTNKKIAFLLIILSIISIVLFIKGTIKL